MRNTLPLCTKLWEPNLAVVLGRARLCPGSRCLFEGAPGPKRSQRTLQCVIKSGFAQAMPREAGPFHPYQVGSRIALLSVLLCVFRMGPLVFISSRACPSSFPSSFVTLCCRHPSKMHRAPSFSPFNIILLLQSGLVLSISPAKHKAALSPIHSSGLGLAFQLTIVPLICTLTVGFAVNARQRDSAGLARLWK